MQTSTWSEQPTVVHGNDSNETLDPDQLFDLLDGHVLPGSRRASRLNIYSICDGHGARWIQLSLRGQPDRSLTLQVSQHEGVEEILRKLTKQIDGTPADEA
jgi:hypothetical protein